MKKFQTEQTTVMMQPVKETLTNNIVNKVANNVAEEVVRNVAEEVVNKVKDVEEIVNKRENDIDEFIQGIAENKKEEK